MPRILFLSHYALPHLGGIEVVIDALARELCALGHEVIHLASSAMRPGEQATDVPPYRVIRVPALNLLESSVGVPWPLFSPQLLPAVLRAVATADVVHGHGSLYLSSAVGLLAARSSRAVRVLTEHVGHVAYDQRVLDGVERFALATLGRVVARRADGIVVLNRKVEAEMRALAPGTRVLTIPNGVDLDRYRPPEPGERQRLRRELGWDEVPRVLFVGRLVAKKGLHLAVAAAERLGPRARLVLVGPGSVERPPKQVEVLGALPPARVAELYRAADVFLLPSRGEGFPLTAQEAMASGLAVVLADDPSYRDYLGGDGVRVAARQPEALAAAVAALLVPEARAAAARAAVDQARREFSWRQAAQAHLRLYDELAASRRRQRC